MPPNCLEYSLSNLGLNYGLRHTLSNSLQSTILSLNKLSITQASKPGAVMAVNPIFHRLELLTGTQAVKNLNEINVAVFGLGGVGSWAAEALVRSGVKNITLVDNDVICITNVNRQLQATVKNVGKSKVDELKMRLEVLNPHVKVSALQKVYEPDNAHTFDLKQYDYVLDCIDSMSCKMELIQQTIDAGATLYSSMGAACKLDPTQIQVASIWESEGCGLARLIRRRLRKAGFDADFQVVFTPEFLPYIEKNTSVACGTHSCMCPDFTPEDGSEHKDWCSTKKVINGSAVHITATFGMFLAGLVVQDVTAKSQSPFEVL